MRPASDYDILTLVEVPKFLGGRALEGLSDLEIARELVTVSPARLGRILKEYSLLRAGETLPQSEPFVAAGGAAEVDLAGCLADRRAPLRIALSLPDLVPSRQTPR